MFNYDVVDDIVSTIVEKFHPKKIIIFGSVASHTANDDSDVDLLVVMDTDKKGPHRAVPLNVSVCHIFVDKDIIVITPQEYEVKKNDEYSMIYDIERTGQVAYEV